MRFTEKLAAIQADAKRIRESMTLYSPNDPALSDNRDMRGYRPSMGLRTAEGMKHVAALAKLIVQVREGKAPVWHLQEAMSTSDFPYLYGDVMYRELLGNYIPYPVTFPTYFKIMDLNDLRTLNLETFTGGTDSSLTKLREREPYPELQFKESKYTVAVSKYGRRYGISLEMLINDNLGAINSRPLQMAVGARRAQELLATTMMCDASGPHATFFSSGNKNLATGALTIPNLQLAYKLLKEQVDEDGEPIVIDMVHLVTTPANEIGAMNILNSLEIRTTDSALGGSTTNQLISANWMKSKLQLSINPYIDIVASNCATEPWFLIASPSNPTGRPAFVFAYLRGRREPQLFVKDPDATSLGGGDSSPLEGNFDNDSIDYKLRHFFGAAQIDPKQAVASFG